MTVRHFVLLGSELNKQHGFSDRYVVFPSTYLHKSISAGACMNVSDLLKMCSQSFAELAREQMKQNGKPISTCALLTICTEIGIHLV